MYESIFKRVEEKYMLTKEEKNIFINAIDKYIEEDKYFKSTICSIYFDNENSDLIVNCLEKPIFKEKVRIRSYNTPTLSDDVFLELKVKYKGVVGKRRIKINLNDFYDYQKNHETKNNTQIMKEISYYFEYYNLQPAVFIAYDRESYKEKGNKNLRITIDNNLRSRTDNLRLENGDKGEKYFDEDIYLLEIKTLGAMPIWLVDVLSKLKMYPTSFSKYGEIYQKEKIKKEGNIC